MCVKVIRFLAALFVWTEDTLLIKEQVVWGSSKRQNTAQQFIIQWNEILAPAFLPMHMLPSDSSQQSHLVPLYLEAEHSVHLAACQVFLDFHVPKKKKKDI